MLPLGVCIEIATGRMYGDSHWAYEFIFLETALILPLGVYIETAIGSIGLHLLGQY